MNTTVPTSVYAQRRARMAAQLGRNGVPVYVFYRKGGAPIVLSEVLGVEEVRSAIASL